MKEAYEQSLRLYRGADKLAWTICHLQGKEIVPEERNKLVGLMNELQAQLSEVRRQVHMVSGE